MRELLHAKFLKETETEETIVFFVTFLSLVEFQLGGGGGGGDRAPWATPPATPMYVTENLSLDYFRQMGMYYTYLRTVPGSLGKKPAVWFEVLEILPGA